MRVIRVLATAAGLLLLAAGTVGVAAHFSGLVSTTATLIASFTPLLLLAVVAALILLLVGGRRFLALLFPPTPPSLMVRSERNSPRTPSDSTNWPAVR